METCIFCNHVFKNKRSLGTHLYHHFKDKTFSSFDEKMKFKHYIQYGIPIPKCPICGKDVVFTSRRLPTTCSSKECSFKYKSNIIKQQYKDNPKRIEYMRNVRLNYLSNKNIFEKTAWGKRAYKQASYLEVWFFENVIIKYHLLSFYKIINEYPLKRYSIDFAFINEKIAVELDGKCHFIHGNERIQKDYEKNIFLKNNGWLVYRISYIDVAKEPNKTISNFIFFLKNKTTQDLDLNQYYKTNISITLSDLRNKTTSKEQDLIRKNKIKKERKDFKQKEEENIKNILKKLISNSNINFQKQGWVKQTLIFLNQHNIKLKGSVSRYIFLHYPDFFIIIKPFMRKNANQKYKSITQKSPGDISF